MKQKISSFVTNALFLLIVLMMVSALYQIYSGEPIIRFFGWGQATVLTGSMEPNIPVDSLIVFHEQADYEVGDPIIYRNEEMGANITHRIIEINGDSITTQGDANNVADPVFNREQIIGKVVLTVPGVGKIVRILQTPKVFLGLIIGIAITWVAPDVYRIFTRRKMLNGKKELEERS